MGWGKKIGGGLAAAGALALVLNVVANRGSSAFTDYTGPDDPVAFKQDVTALSKEKNLFVFYHLDECPHCRNALKNLRDVRSSSPLDYDVLKVEVSRYPRIRKENMLSNYVPEAHLYFGKEAPFILGSQTPSGNTAIVLQDQDVLIQFLRAVDEWKTMNTPSSADPEPRAPAPKKIGRILQSAP